MTRDTASYISSSIISTDLPLLTDGQTHNYNFNDTIIGVHFISMKKSAYVLQSFYYN